MALAPGIQVGIHGDHRYVPVEALDDGDVPGMVPSHGDGELPVPDGGAHDEFDLIDHILGEDKIVAVAVIEDVQFRLVGTVLEMCLFKIVGTAPDGAGTLSRTRFETGGVVIRDPVDTDVRIVVRGFGVCERDPGGHDTTLQELHPVHRDDVEDLRTGLDGAFVVLVDLHRDRLIGLDVEERNLVVLCVEDLSLPLVDDRDLALCADRADKGLLRTCEDAGCNDVRFCGSVFSGFGCVDRDDLTRLIIDVDVSSDLQFP